MSRPDIVNVDDLTFVIFENGDLAVAVVTEPEAKHYRVLVVCPPEAVRQAACISITDEGMKR